MNKRAVAIIFSFLVILVLTTIGVGLIARSISEKNFALRHINSSRAFWLAEAGVADAIRNFPTSPINNSLPLLDPNHTYLTTTTRPDPVNYPDRYTIQSTGTVTLPSGAIIQRRILVDVLQHILNIGYALIGGGDINARGSVSIVGPGPIPPGGLNIDPNFVLAPTINTVPHTVPFTFPTFESIFGITEAEMRAQADHIYIDSGGGINNPEPTDGITFVDITDGQELLLNSNWSGGGYDSVADQGGGILVVNGNVRMTGNAEFYGVIWVNGALDIGAGTNNIFGAMFVNSATIILRGNCAIQHDPDRIGDAGNQLDPTTIAGTWQEF